MTTTQKPLVPSPLQELTVTTLPILQSDLNINDTTLFAVYCFIKNFVGDSTTSTPTVIDERIELALDLVKRYLLYAIHQEIDILKQRITLLLDRIGQLEQENHFLRANVSPHVLNVLYSLPKYYSPPYNSNKPADGGAHPPTSGN